jgi:hypothetical protein
MVDNTQKNICKHEDYNINLIDDLYTLELNKTNLENNKEYEKVINFYWYPNNIIIKLLYKYCQTNNYKNILEVGPGISPFLLANHFIGMNEKNDNYTSIDIDVDKIPHNNNFFDFIYARHVLEDVQNPDFALKEFLRVSKSGYFETPSPIVELTKGVCCYNTPFPYLGYLHHRYIVWTDLEKNIIYFLPKYGFLENTLEMKEPAKSKLFYLLNNYPVYWNTYYIWNEKTNNPTIIMYKNGVNIGLNNNLVEDYVRLISSASQTTIRSTNYFINNYKSFL